MKLGFYSYLAAGLAFGVFALLLLFSRRANLPGRLLIVTAVVSALWAAAAAYAATAADYQAAVGYRTLEILRYIAWYAFLLQLFAPLAIRSVAYRRFLRITLPLGIGLGGLLLGGEYYLRPLHRPDMLWGVGHLVLAVIGLAIIEQLFRNTTVQHRLAVKPLFIGAGALFTYDLFIYADALLFGGMDPALWGVRGIINVFAVPLLAISAARNKDWSLNIFVSRDIVLSTTAILGVGLYLLAMAGVGYYVRDYSGTWGTGLQAAFFSLAVLLLTGILYSGQLRARLRVFLGKHFYSNKYDYRREWLNLTRLLNEKIRSEDKLAAVIQALADIVDARSGLLWTRDEQERYLNTTAWNHPQLDVDEPLNGSLAQFFDRTHYIINVVEIDQRTDEYGGLDLPVWLADLHRPWLIVPLFEAENLKGFVVLCDPLNIRQINWEDRDLLKTAAGQVTSYLTVLTISDALARSRQFELFNRLSSYMVHDLKNIAAELNLISRNAERHKRDQDFIEDAFQTVSHAASEIQRLLDQLRSRQSQAERKSVVELDRLIREVVQRQGQRQRPVPTYSPVADPCHVVIEKKRLFNVLSHIIDNAQQATAADGRITVTLARDGAHHVIRVADTGKGMDQEFIQKRLFRPFDTTKGNAGMGIGMYESREFIRAAGGQIRVASEPDNGTQVSLAIPAAPPAALGDG